MENFRDSFNFDGNEAGLVVGVLLVFPFQHYMKS
jgi:hypothetical protein